MQPGVKLNIKKSNSSYFLTLTVVDWIDVFTRENYKTAIIDGLKFCINNKALNVFAYCLMTNHLHLVVNCNEPFQLADVIRDFKRHTVKAVISKIKTEPESRKEWMLKLFQEAAHKSTRNEKYKFWQTGNHAIELYNEQFIWTKINYIHNNPVVEKFVSKPEDWLYSSASNYLFGHGALQEVYTLPPMQKVVR